MISLKTLFVLGIFACLALMTEAQDSDSGAAEGNDSAGNNSVDITDSGNVFYFRIVNTK